MKKFIRSLVNLLSYVIYQFIIFGKVIHCKLSELFISGSLMENDPFIQIQFLLGLVLYEERGNLKYSDSSFTIYLLKSYTNCLIDLIRTDGKLSMDDEIILKGISENKYIDENFKIIKKAQLITNM